MEEKVTTAKGIDAETFFVPRIPMEVEKMIHFLRKPGKVGDLQVSVFQKVIEKCSKYLREPTTVGQRDFDELVEDTQLQPWTISTLFAGTFLILQKVIRNRVKMAVVERDLLALGLPSPFVSAFLAEVQALGGGPGFRQALLSPSNSRRPQNPQVKRLRWRVDVTISTSAVSRVMRPSILMQMVLSNGCIKTFEVSPEQFHRLRHSVAKVLRHMQELERHPIMRIAAYAEKRSENG